MRGKLARLFVYSATVLAAICIGQTTIWAADADKPADDKKFVADAASGGMLEVALGKYAAQNAASDDVKKFGDRMIADHSKANDELMKIAQDKAMTPGKEMNDEDKKVYDDLTKAKGADFDKQYIHHMVMDHEKDVAEFQNEATKGQDAAIKTFAAKTLPTLQEHLIMAKAIDAKLNGAAAQK